MRHEIVKIEAGNYTLFDDMIYWRTNGNERQPLKEAVSDIIISGGLEVWKEF